MDRACFDYLMIEDGSFVTDAHGSSEWHLRNAARVPNSMPLVPLLGQRRDLGIVTTMTTGFTALSRRAVGDHARPPDARSGGVQPSHNTTTYRAEF